MITSQQAPPPQALHQAPRWIQHLQLDERSLALFRIGLGLLGLINVLVRATAVEFLPAAGSIDLTKTSNSQPHGAWSLHALGGDSLAAQFALLAAMGICIAPGSAAGLQLWS